MNPDKSVMPISYAVVSGLDSKKLTIGMGFSEFNKEAMKHIMCNGKVYARGSLTIVSKQLANTFCSMREYHLTKLKDIPNHSITLEDIEHLHHVVVINKDESKYILAKVDPKDGSVEYVVHSNSLYKGRSLPHKGIEGTIKQYNLL